MRPGFVAIEGPIGVGKSTLAKRLARHWQAELMLERPADNPFLERFYAHPRRHALATQLTFLFERVDQYRQAQQQSLFASTLVSDFVFDKDPLFARLLLDEAEYALYRQVFEHLRPQCRAPDVVVLLRAPIPVLLERIARRGLAMERAIDAAYLERLDAAYAEWFSGYRAAPVLLLDTRDCLDPRSLHTDEGERELQSIAARIERHGRNPPEA
ncbi:MAG: deoxynucleoside kinase, partial [Burkholderiaceae bacterium]|nr:deoxynucleoside kinase [Burkholderiaceae bacterium]